MVPNIRRGRRFKQAIEYVLADKADKTRQRPGARLLRTRALLSVTTAGREMAAVAALSLSCKRPMLHYMVSLAQGERLDDASWVYVLDELDKVAGLDPAHQGVDVVHEVVPNSGTLAEHVHAIRNVICSKRGRTSSDHWDANLRWRMQARCRELERELGLTELGIDREARDAGPSRGQLRRQARTGTPSLLEAAGPAITVALAQPTLPLIIDRLATLGLRLEPYLRKGTVVGLHVVDASDPRRREGAFRFGGNGLHTISARIGQAVSEWAWDGLGTVPGIQPCMAARPLKAHYDAVLAVHRHRMAEWQTEGRTMSQRHIEERHGVAQANAKDAPDLAEPAMALAITRLDPVEHAVLRQLLQAYRKLRAERRRRALQARQAAERQAHAARQPGRQPVWLEFLKARIGEGRERAREAQRELERLWPRQSRAADGVEGAISRTTKVRRAHAASLYPVQLPAKPRPTIAWRSGRER